MTFKVLQATEDGGYASDLLLEHSRELDSRDAGLAAQIVFGCLRRQGQLDWMIASMAKRDADRMDSAVRVALRMGLFQLRHLDRVPAHAALNESVELVKRSRKTSAAGLVNAVLRRAPRGKIDWPDRSVALSMPQWLLARWEEQFGAEMGERIAEEFLREPETFVRNPPPDSGIELEATEIPGAFRVVSGSVTGLRIQDLSSQSVVPLLHLDAGQTFLDVCSAPGNKTTQALEAGVQAIACDANHRRLQTVAGCARVTLDATEDLPFRGTFDRILVDAPCSGTGTLGRNPEIRWKLRPRDLGELHAKQVRILRNALAVLKPGGRLVYSTCSLEQAENEQVVEEVVASSGHQVLATRYRIPGRDAGDGFFAAVLQ